jgi:hypothetical protein
LWFSFSECRLRTQAKSEKICGGPTEPGMGWGGGRLRDYSDLTETVAVTGARALARFRVILFADIEAA